MPEPSTGSALAVLAQVRFHDGTRQPYDIPRDTLDPRFRLCSDHHPACDCREAETSERLAELGSELHELNRFQAMARAVAQLHRPQGGKSRYWNGPFCVSCSYTTPWPCPTLALVAEIDWRAKAISEGDEVTW